jgi:hypothetical protein
MTSHKYSKGKYRTGHEEKWSVLEFGAPMFKPIKFPDDVEVCLHDDGRHLQIVGNPSSWVFQRGKQKVKQLIMQRRDAIVKAGLASYHQVMGSTITIVSEREAFQRKQRMLAYCKTPQGALEKKRRDRDSAKQCRRRKRHNMSSEEYHAKLTAHKAKKREQQKSSLLAAHQDKKRQLPEFASAIVAHKEKEGQRKVLSTALASLREKKRHPEFVSALLAHKEKEGHRKVLSTAFSAHREKNRQERQRSYAVGQQEPQVASALLERGMFLQFQLKLFRKATLMNFIIGPEI